MRIGSRKIEDVNLSELNLLFLHVFQARIVISDDDEASDNNPMSSVIDRSQSPTFKDKFFIVLVDQKENEDIIMMFSLTIFSQTPQSIFNFDTEALPGEKRFLGPSSPLAPSMAKLNFDAELVCRQVMPLPEGTRLSNVVPAARHLSSSSIYPCETPYFLVSSDNDDSVRFWRCIKVTEPDSPNKYEWREWNMISENHPSELGVEGAIVKVNATQPLRATQQTTLRHRTGALESATTATHQKENESQTVLDILKSEGVFETARMCSPILPQYNPKQLIVFLKAAKKQRVKAILNHVVTSLKHRKGAAHNPLSRAASIKRMSTVDRGSQDQATPADARINDDDSMDYDEIDDIPFLPLYALFEADFDTNVISEKPEELVAKMHLLAIAVTLSHFVSDAKDKVEQVNAVKNLVMLFLILIHLFCRLSYSPSVVTVQDCFFGISLIVLDSQFRLTFS
ncbi:hypothetical protein CAEBREN_30816 [Caenorhabditis brenneri]|uniref:Uncharacterized protein n=1 Tax=Caenorhabditis brenneri TaxID=135651 RepID=G0NZC1_CAEBE|nr:hypothetical protein CAEBREN_30816 [Caenorhabditis brenneri]